MSSVLEKWLRVVLVTGVDSANDNLGLDIDSKMLGVTSPYPLLVNCISELCVQLSYPNRATCL